MDGKPPVRESISTLRRWCPIEETHQDADDPICQWIHTDDWYKVPHRLRLRRMLVCSKCQQGYFKRDQFEQHECFSVY